MNPLELQVLAIVCRVAGADQAPASTEPVRPRPTLVALPPAKPPARPTRPPALR